VTLKPGLGITQCHRNRHGSIRRLWLPIRFHSKHGPISYRFREKRRFQSEIANFSHPVYLTPQLKEFSLKLGIGARGQKTRIMGLPGRTGSLTIYLAVWIQSTNVTDRRTPGDRKDRAYVKSRGKKTRLKVSLFSFIVKRSTVNNSDGKTIIISKPSQWILSSVQSTARPNQLLWTFWVFVTSKICFYLFLNVLECWESEHCWRQLFKELFLDGYRMRGTSLKTPCVFYAC